MIIEGTDNTPKVEMNSKNRSLLIQGESRPEDVRSFYKPILDWIDNELLVSLIDEESVTIRADFKMDYFNSASSKYLLDILEKLKELTEQHNANLEINWHYEQIDEDMRDAGEEFSLLTELQMNFIPMD